MAPTQTEASDPTTPVAQAKVIIYTTDPCSFCERAKNLLKARAVPFKEIEVSRDDSEKRQEMFLKSKMRTFPQIWFGEELIGGFTELDALDKKIGLNHLK